MTPAGEAIAAMTADDVAFGCDQFAFLEIGHRAPDLIDDADEFMSDDQRHRDRLLRPRVPVINMDIGAADRRLLHANANVVRPDLRHGNFLQFEPRLGAALSPLPASSWLTRDEARQAASAGAKSFGFRAVERLCANLWTFVPFRWWSAMAETLERPPPKPVTATLTFLFRFASTIVLWSVALLIIFSGYEIAFFALIGSLGLLSLWEFYGMLDHKGLPNFKITAMICGAHHALRQLLLFLEGRARPFLRLRDGRAARISAHGFHPADVREPARRRAAADDGLHALRPALRPLALQLHHENRLRRAAFARPARSLGQFYVLYLIAITKFSDMGAYLTGSVIGRHQMVPHISPKKTWEGFVGRALLFAPRELGNVLP